MGASLKQDIRDFIKGLIPPILWVSELTRGTTEAAYRAIVARKHVFRTVIDVGASDGRWSAGLMRHFPDLDYVLIEAQPIHEKALKKFTGRHPNARYVLAAAGAEQGTIYFDATAPFSGQASYTPYPMNNIEVPVTTVDAQVAAGKLPGPYLVKLDTHGFEIPILSGAAETLKQTEIIFMECYNFRIAPECLLFYEMCKHLEGLGFRCIDMVEPVHRPHDNSLWQMDLVFVKDNRAEFSYLGYE